LEHAGYGSQPKPHGVVGQVIPWNFPLLMLAWKVAPALATGNTVVLKPAETTPLTALLFAEICQQAELPAGVVNIITGDGRTGSALVKHPGVDKIAFTGSTEVGKLIAQSVATSGKSVTLELGGKGANIVFEDSPIDQAVEGIVNGIFFNQGHVCCAGSRLLLQENIHDEFLHKLQVRMSKIRSIRTLIWALSTLLPNLQRFASSRNQVNLRAPRSGLLHVICRQKVSGLRPQYLPA
jgi:aldehyde dehydrogenase (NAD+)